MAKQNSIKLEDYILVTELNRKMCIRLGRKVHILSQFNGTIKSDGEFIIRPRLTEGWYYWGTNKCFVTKDESREEYVQSFKEVIDHFIKQKQLFINPKQHIVKFEKP